MRRKLLLATNNQAKVSEYKALLNNINYDLLTPAELGIHIAVAEVGNSLEENARIKAVAFAGESQLLSMADDSGLEVDALGGEPGTLSARYAGEGASDRERIDYLLVRMKDLPWEKRSARFRCVIAIGAPGGDVELCHGECDGRIAFAPKGGHGFGYDPVFYLPEFDKTMAELPLEVKNRVSHRGKAARKARQVLERWTQDTKGAGKHYL